jgi:hypothetical protein
MADFDDAERHAIHEVGPVDQLKWLLEEVDEDLQFFGWLQTQVSPLPAYRSCAATVWPGCTPAAGPKRPGPA